MLLSLLMISGIFIGCSDDTDDPIPVTDLNVALVATAPTLDGVGTDAAWDEADALELNLGENVAYSSVANINTDLTLKAVRTATDLYILAEWMDHTTTESVDKKLWTYDDGNWSQGGNEDRLFFFFDMGQNGEQKADCSSMCHVGEGMWTDTGIVDQWHWKANRTAPIHRADDKYIDNNYTDSNGNVVEDAGQHGDSKTKGLYHDNVNSGFPLYSGVITDGHYLILPSGESADSYFTSFDANTADTTVSIPGYWVDENADGSRADVVAYSSYSGGKWTVEFKRALVTTHDDDVAFTTASGDQVQVTVAVTDDDGGKHVGSEPFYIIF